MCAPFFVGAARDRVSSNYIVTNFVYAATTVLRVCASVSNPNHTIGGLTRRRVEMV
jgi:hypothetical protein